MNENSYPDVKVSIDVVIFKIIDGQLNVLLHKRPIDSRAYANAWALPGGYVHADTETTLHDTVKRVLSEKAGIDIDDIFYQQFFTYANSTRDPDGWSSAIAHYAISRIDCDDALDASAKYFRIDDLPALGFDHKDIVIDAVHHIQNKSNYSSLPAYFLGETFSLTELQKMYEFLTDQKLNLQNFRRKIEPYEFLVEVEDKLKLGNHRPAKVYALKNKAIKLFDKSI